MRLTKKQHLINTIKQTLEILNTWDYCELKGNPKIDFEINEDLVENLIEDLESVLTDNS
tara:strand:- start:209 stop:385 length:177 start_codon:yes stop_codon:yes gene_type:complete